MKILLIVQSILAGALMWSCFVRLAKTNAETVREIRWAIWFLFCCAGLVFASPILPMLDSSINWRSMTTPAWIWISLLAAIVMVQVATSRHWKHGPPSSYQEQ